MSNTPKQQPALDEQDLLQRAHNFEQDALTIIFDSYYDPIYQYIYRHLRHAETAEDLTADVFRVFLENLNTKRGPNKFLKAWLYRVAHNLIIDEIRRNKHRDTDTLDDEHQDDSPHLGQQVEKILQRKAIRQAMRHLTDKQQGVIFLKFFHGLSNEEIAYALNMTVGTVKSLQHRGLHSLRNFINRYGEFDLNE
jgi:RNA polymerase sigma-70 factor, ECF subfamily